MKYIIVPIVLMVWSVLVYIAQTLAVLVNFLYQFEIKKEWYKYNPDWHSERNEYREYPTVFHWCIKILKELKD